MHLTPILVFALLAGSFAVAEDPVLHSPAGTVTFSPSTGAIIAMTPPNATGSVWQSGENGLWSARFANRTQLNAARFHATNTLFRFSWQAGPDKDALTFVYTASNLAVNVVARPCSDGIELSAEVAPAVQTLLRFDLPGRLRFSPASVKRFVFPHGVNTGPGAAFTQAFFERYPDTRPPRPLHNPPPADPSPAAALRARLAARTAQGRATGASARVHNQFETTVRDQLRSSLGKARRFYEQGQQDYQAGHVIKAAGALELAVQFDPHNQDYQALLDKCKTEARQVRIVQLIHQGEQSESYQQYKQALHCYREAVELEPEDGKVYFRLARLVRHEEDNDREALNLLREAVLRDPDVIEYRMALGGLYGELGLKLNARREFQAVVALQKDHAEARAALKAL